MDQRIFPAVISIPSSEEKREARVSFSPSSLRVQFADRTVDYTWSRLRMELAGFKQQLLFIELPGAEGSFYIEKTPPLLDALRSIHDPKGPLFAKKMRSSEWQSIGLVLIVLLIAAGSLFALWSTQDTLVKGAAQLVTPSQEKAVGENILKLLLPPGKRVKDPELLASLDTLMAPLFQANGIDPKSVTLILSRDRQINAFAFMGGYLVFNRGLISNADSAEEFLGVAAHELAHISQRHSLRSAIKGVGIYAIVSLLLSDITGLIAVLADQGTFLLQQGYSRDFEREADSFGFAYLVKAHIDPRGLLTFFKKINEKSFLENFEEEEAAKAPADESQDKAEKSAEGDKPEDEEKEKGIDLNKALSMISTHPMTSERIEQLEKRLSELSAEEKATLKPVAFDWKEFQRLVAADTY